MARWPTPDPRLASFSDVAYIAPIFGNPDTVTYQFIRSLNILFVCAPASIFPVKIWWRSNHFIRMSLTSLCTVHVSYQVVHYCTLSGHLFSTPEILLSDAYAELVVSLKRLLSEWHLFCAPKIYLSGAYYWYRRIDIAFDYASNRTTFVLCLLRRHLIRIYIDIDIAYFIAFILLFLSVYL